MRLHFAIALTAALGTALIAASASSADTTQQGNMKGCAANWKTMTAAQKGTTKYKDYMSTCMKAPVAPGKTVAAAPTAAPAPAMAPAMAMKASKPAKPVAAAAGSAKCKDGKVVTYAHRSGTCSGHGGVATWM